MRVIQPWWLGGRASASHSVESSHYCLSGSNPAWDRDLFMEILNKKEWIYIRSTDVCYGVMVYKVKPGYVKTMDILDLDYIL